MPVVDDPYDFGRIASANAISDVYAMGGRPILAIAILGWPVDKIPAAVASKVLEGSRHICREAGIPLAGGHSIDSQEPIFGLAVNGLVAVDHIKKNNQAKQGDLLFLTKPLGVGILTTAEKKGLLRKEDEGIAAKQMIQLNKAGEALGKLKEVTALTDITGFGLLGHLLEMAEGSGLSAELNFEAVPLIVDNLRFYIDLHSLPGGTGRNWESYGGRIAFASIRDVAYQKAILADPQTSGGLLISVSATESQEVKSVLEKYGLSAFSQPIGRITEKKEAAVSVTNFIQ
jgi:selenide,water dikinase